MPSKKSKGGYYAVQKGRTVGIYNTWDDCEAQVKGYQGAKFKKFDSLVDAQQFAFPLGAPPVAPQPVSAGATGTSQSTSSLTAAPVVEIPPLNDNKRKTRDFDAKITDPEKWNIVYSDGACKGNGKPGSVAGIGVWWGLHDDRNLAERCPGEQTNNRAELIAILRVFETLPPMTKPLLIRTDSQYAMSCLGDWIRKWKLNNWKTSMGDPVKNAGIIRCISLYLDIRGKLGHKVALEYIKGHSGDMGNDGADTMANIGTTMPSAAERDWDALTQDLQERFDQIEVGSDGIMPFKTCMHDTEELTTERPTKIQKISEQDIAAVSGCQPLGGQTSPIVESHSTGTSGASNLTLKQTAQSSETLKPISGSINKASPMIIVQAQDVNIDDYADCLLDDSELAKELFD